MNLTNNVNYKDGCVWWCVKKVNVKHDIKINIRNNSIFENVINTDIRLLYFILLENYILNIPLNTVYRNCKQFSKDFSIEPVSRNCLSKIYYIIRNKIIQTIHKKCDLNPMGQESCIDGKSKIEIDESKFITYNNSVRWMFGLVDMGKYDIRIFYVNDNRQKETLLPIIKKYAYTNALIDNNYSDIDDIELPTRIYSDSFQS